MAQRQRSVSTQIPSVRQDHSRPFLTQQAMLSSLHAQQVFDRGYEMCANALFSLSVVLRFIGSEAQAQEVDALVDALIDQTPEDLRQESLRIREVVESNGIETAIGYTSAKMRRLLSSPWHRNVAAVSTTTLRTSLRSSSDDWRLVPRYRSHRSTHRQGLLWVILLVTRQLIYNFY